MSDSPFLRIGNLLGKKKSLWLILLVLVLVFVLLVTTEDKESVPEEEGFDEAAYTAQLEERTSTLLSRVSGAGEVYVMLTMDSFYEEEYAADHSAEDVVREDSHSSTVRENVVLQTEKNGSKQPIIQSVRLPRVRGVSVVCQGGSNALVQKKIIELVSALFDLSANQISVTN